MGQLILQRDLSAYPSSHPISARKTSGRGLGPIRSFPPGLPHPLIDRTYQWAGRIEVAQRMAWHSNAKTNGLYDRRNYDISVGEVERIGI